MGSSCSLFALSELIRLIATPQSLAWHLHIASSPSSSSSESKSRRRKPPLTNPQRRAGSARPARLFSFFTSSSCALKFPSRLPFHATASTGRERICTRKFSQTIPISVKKKSYKFSRCVTTITYQDLVSLMDNATK